MADGWKEARAAKSVTRPELVNKLLLTIDALITQVNESGDPMAMAGLGDKLAIPYFFICTNVAMLLAM
jgi:hypothetical protein